MSTRSSTRLAAILSLVILMIVCLERPVSGQFEVCHWECVLIGCDYYGDCDYDCYEVCDYWRQDSDLPATENKKLAREGASKNGVTMKLKAQNATGTVEQNHRMTLWNELGASNPTKSTIKPEVKKLLNTQRQQGDMFAQMR